MAPSASLARRGLTEDEAQRAIGPLESSRLADATASALRQADTLASLHPEVDDKQFAELRRHGDVQEILELAVALSLTTGWQRFIDAFGIRPNQWSPGELRSPVVRHGPAGGGPWQRGDR